MRDITISDDLKVRCPNLRLGCIEAEVKIAESDRTLLAEINERLEQLRTSLVVEDISKIPAIAASRKGYKSCGKDPARYRLSAEALLRRIVSGKGLYQINNVVDHLNVVSVTSGFSIGGYDADAIEGDICFGIGRAEEPYSGIGRGELNIENLPVFRDQKGAFGTPTSDSQRTEVSSKTKKFLMILIDFERDDKLEDSKEMAIRLLTAHCEARNIKAYNIV